MRGGGMRDGAWVCATGALKKIKQGLSFEMRFVCPAGTGLFFLCCFGRLRGGRQGKGTDGGRFEESKIGLVL